MTTVGRWSPNKVRARVLDGTWVSPPEELGGMVLLTPTSIAYTGTSASIGANGSVEFTAVTDLELRGVFSADYDNYMIAIRTSSSGNINVQGRLLDNTTPASGLNYTYQTLEVNGSSVQGFRSANNGQWNVHDTYNTQRSGSTIYLYGPKLAQPTAYRYVSAEDFSSALINDRAGTHSLSTAYDGFMFICPVNNMTGLVSVYGLVGA